MRGQAEKRLEVRGLSTECQKQVDDDRERRAVRRIGRETEAVSRRAGHDKTTGPCATAKTHQHDTGQGEFYHLLKVMLVL